MPVRGRFRGYALVHVSGPGRLCSGQRMRGFDHDCPWKEIGDGQHRAGQCQCNRDRTNGSGSTAGCGPGRSSRGGDFSEVGVAAGAATEPGTAIARSSATTSPTPTRSTASRSSPAAGRSATISLPTQDKALTAKAEPVPARSARPQSFVALHRNQLVARTISSPALHVSAPCASAASSRRRRMAARIRASRHPTPPRGRAPIPACVGSQLIAAGRTGACGAMPGPPTWPRRSVARPTALRPQRRGAVPARRRTLRARAVARSASSPRPVGNGPRIRRHRAGVCWRHHARRRCRERAAGIPQGFGERFESIGERQDTGAMIDLLDCRGGMHKLVRRGAVCSFGEHRASVARVTPGENGVC